MKVVVLVPSTDYRSSAGARIRYGRLSEGLGSIGIELALITIADFEPQSADCDALVVSKCHDARSLLAAAIMSARGKLVGADLFDDYFSQHHDSRLLAYRQWLAALLQISDFCLCSTAALASVVQQYKPGIPTHVINDPAPDQDPDKVVLAAEAKAAEARKQRVIRAAWFGVGDNPYFKVGLPDLFTHASVLRSLGCDGIALELTIVTNRRALDADGLEMISRLPFQTTIREWSAKIEREVLDAALVAFLPVATQSFSAAKSLNRAFTALSHGCQILSAGYPLYAALDPLIYSDPEPLLKDLEAGRLRLSSANSAAYRDRLDTFGSAETEASRFKDFIKNVSNGPFHQTSRRLCVIHGLATRAEVHQLAKAVGALSVASPYCSAVLDFDAVFRGIPPNMAMTTPASVAQPDGARGRRVKQPGGRIAAALSAVPTGSFAYQFATYAKALEEMESRLTDQFGPIRVILSDTSRVPVPAPQPEPIEP